MNFYPRSLTKSASEELLPLLNKVLPTAVISGRRAGRFGDIMNELADPVFTVPGPDVPENLVDLPADPAAEPLPEVKPAEIPVQHQPAQLPALSQILAADPDSRLLVSRLLRDAADTIENASSQPSTPPSTTSATRNPVFGSL